jgi:uncharacterized damage-inducible protein DinB
VDLLPSTAIGYLHLGFGRLLAVAEALGDELVGQRPHGPATNSVSALVVHCCGVTGYWLGHVGLGRPSSRDRDAEFEATAPVAELRSLVERTLEQAEADIAALAAGAPASPHAARRRHLVDETDAGLVLHVVEELFQHLGHAELAADALRARS